MRLPLFALILAAGMSCTLIAGESPVGRSTNTGYRNHPLTIDQAVQLALKQNPSILQQIQQIKIQKGLFYQAQSKLLPQLTANSNYSQNDTALNPSLSAGRSNIDLLGVPSGSTLSTSTFSTGLATNSVVAIPATAGGSSGSAEQTWQVTLTASQLIYDGGKPLRRAGQR